jgi:hypothetical protein
MAETTGIILAIGGITMVNQSLINNQPLDLRVPVATGIAAGCFALAEKGWKDGAVALAWLGLVTILFARVDPKVPTPVESANKFFFGK